MVGGGWRGPAGGRCWWSGVCKVWDWRDAGRWSMGRGGVRRGMEEGRRNEVGVGGGGRGQGAAGGWCSVGGCI